MGKGGGSSAPPAPDYSSLAKQQSALNQQTAYQQTVANRPNQSNPYGSLTWTNSPTMQKQLDAQAYASALEAYSKNPSGQAPNQADFYKDMPVDSWTQTVTLGPEQQAIYNAQTSNQQNAMNLAGQALQNVDTSPLDLSKMGDVRQLDFSNAQALPDSGFGAVQQVQDAMMSRLQPGLTQARDQEIQRLKSQGITEGTPAWESAMRSLNNQQNDANQQALLGATRAYNDIFNRGLASRQQTIGEDTSLYNNDVANRNRNIQEALLQQQNPISLYSSLVGGGGGSAQMPSFGNYTQATPYSGPDIAGAAQNQYNANMNAYNASQQANANRNSGLFGLAGTLLTAPMGGNSLLGKGLGLLGGLF